MRVKKGSMVKQEPMPMSKGYGKKGKAKKKMKKPSVSKALSS